MLKYSRSKAFPPHRFSWHWHCAGIAAVPCLGWFLPERNTFKRGGETVTKRVKYYKQNQLHGQETKILGESIACRDPFSFCCQKSDLSLPFLLLMLIGLVICSGLKSRALKISWLRPRETPPTWLGFVFCLFALQSEDQTGSCWEILAIGWWSHFDFCNVDSVATSRLGEHSTPISP